MQRLTFGLLLLNLLVLPALGQEAVPTTFPLAPSGEITHWLMLGYIPLKLTPPTYAQVLAADLLNDVGGEAKVQPAAGEKIKLAASPVIARPVELTWRLARSRPPMIADGWQSCFSRERVHLFADEQGRPLTGTACYLYCQLISPEDKNLNFLVGPGDSCKMMLNGEVVYRTFGSDKFGVVYKGVDLRIKKGRNRLLVRLDGNSGYGGFAGRLVDSQGAVPDTIRVELALRPGVPEAHTDPPPPTEPWDKVLAEIPPIAAAEQSELLGARIPRTMSLLESGPWTRRPVRIVFYGQSIEFHWVDLLVQRLKERYPNTIILAENHALGGWNVFRLVRAMKHDIVRQQPDLVLFHAYNGTYDEWERLFQTLRKETCAEIITRTGHIAGWDAKGMDKVVNDETIMLRTLARKYDIELVEVRREWIDYLRANNFKHTDLLDQSQVHMSRKGVVLMAQLYERHFRASPLPNRPWMNNVRYYSAARQLDEGRFDEITLHGPDWQKVRLGAVAHGAGNRLELRFTGTRVDLVLMPGESKATVLIDGQAPSTMHLFHGNRPLELLYPMHSPATLIQYFIGPDARAETWEMTFNNISPDGNKFRFKLHGSFTGNDGEGSSDKRFVSRSGRITIEPDDWVPLGWPAPPGFLPPTLTWNILGDYRDQAQYPAASQEPFAYVTVADGLPPGEHKLTLIPDGTGSFSIHAVEAYNPPMAGK